jgi:cell wall-associated NlpC family hydrolase
MPAKKTTAKKTTAKKTTAKKTTAKKTTAKKTTAKKTTAKRATAKKTAAKRATARQTAAKRATARPSARPVRRRSSLKHARRGDLIVVDSSQVGSPPREGEVLRVIRGELNVSYRVRWADGHETLIAPAAGTLTVVQT